MSTPPKTLDFHVTGGGTVYLVTPLNGEAEEHLNGHTGEESLWLGNSLAVEHRFIADLVAGLQGDGFTVS